MKRMIVLLLLLTACAHDSGQNQDRADFGVIVGGSIMRGLPLKSYQGVPLENFGVGGRTCKEVVDTLIWAGPVKLAILNCGHNGFEPGAIKQELLRAVAWSFETGSELIILNLNNIPEIPEREPQIIELNEWISRLPVRVFDFYSWAKAQGLQGVHPNAEQYEVMMVDLFGEVE